MTPFQLLFSRKSYRKKNWLHYILGVANGTVPRKSWHWPKRFIQYGNLDSLCEESQSVVYTAFISVWSLACFGFGLGFASKDPGISANLAFYHLSPLILKVHVQRIKYIVKHGCCRWGEPSSFQCLQYLICPGDNCWNCAILQAVMMSPLREKGVTKQGYLTKALFHGETNGTPGAKVL